MSPRFKEGWEEGYVLRVHGYQMHEGKYGGKWNNGGYTENGVSYGNGFAEGFISGRVAIMMGEPIPEWASEMIKKLKAKK